MTTKSKTAKRLTANLGRFGKVSMKLKMTKRQRNPSCNNVPDAKPGTEPYVGFIQNGVLKGKFKFRATNGTTHAKFRKIPVQWSSQPAQACWYRIRYGNNNAGGSDTKFLYADLYGKRGKYKWNLYGYRELTKNGKPAALRAQFITKVVRKVGKVHAGWSMYTFGAPSTFIPGTQPRTVVFKPPAPFTGTYTVREPGENEVPHEEDSFAIPIARGNLTLHMKSGKVRSKFRFGTKLIKDSFLIVNT